MDRRTHVQSYIDKNYESGKNSSLFNETKNFSNRNLIINDEEFKNFVAGNQRKK